jgi:hypothetical protein
MLFDVARLIFLNEEYLIDLAEAVRVGDAVRWCFERSLGLLHDLVTS